MEWPLKYIDDKGTVETKIYSDGKNLSTRLRGVIFKGTDLDCLSPEKETYYCDEFELRKPDTGYRG